MGSADAKAASLLPLVRVSSEGQRPSCHDEMARVTAKAMLASPHIRKRCFIPVPHGSGCQNH